MRIPIYNQDEDKCPDGMYLALFHGRDDPKQDMEDWGFDGPIIGPLRYLHTTYESNVKFSFINRHVLRAYEVYGLKSADDIMFRTEEGCLPFQDKFYGDWTVFTIVGGRVVQ